MAINFQDLLENQVELSWTPPQNFYLVINRLPSLMFTLQRCQIPVITGDELMQSQPMNTGRLSIPGNSLEYSVLSCDFLIDKELKTYRSILKWMKENYAPEDKAAQWQSWEETMSDATLIGTDAGNQPLYQWNFKDCFPISLDGPMLDATMPDIEYLVANVTFKFSYFTLNTYTNGTDNNDTI